MYKVLIERTAERDLKYLPTAIFNRIVPRINALADIPRPSGSHKLAGSKNDWRIRIGDYRVVYEIDDGKQLTDQELRRQAVQALSDSLGPVDALRFLALISREPFDYQE